MRSLLHFQIRQQMRGVPLQDAKIRLNRSNDSLTLIVLVVLVKLLLHLRGVRKLLSVVLVHLLPYVPELASEVLLEIVSMNVESLIVVDQVLEP